MRHAGFQERKGLAGENVGLAGRRPQSGGRERGGGGGGERGFEGEKVGGELGDGEDEEWEEREQKEEGSGVRRRSTNRG